ncbi:pappalysin-1-like [Antedon mediterranea]|uniref:pappalysin-1-like n=1 Tax=Antedon mediterranea TaxID=105859 RepID=UPI003AF70662
MDYAAYFAGTSGLLRLTNIETIPRGNFSISFWMKPEGGQFGKTDVLRLRDKCEELKSTGWGIGITTNRQKRDAHLYFQLKTDRSKTDSFASAPFRYDVHRWYHIAATYNESTIQLYINGAMVSAKNEQRGPLFSEFKRQCKELEFGGSFEFGVQFRGAVDDMRMWSKVLSHRQVAQLYNNQSHLFQDNNVTDKLVFWDPFDNFTSWTNIDDEFPDLIPSDLSSKKHDLSLKTPKCGITVCDNPIVMRSYIDRSSLRRPKLVRYRLINIANDDGSNPMLSQEQIERQHNELNKAFNRYNITFLRHDHLIRNSTLRRTRIIPVCESEDVGNGRCDPLCSPRYTGNDGGDCDVFDARCPLSRIGNGRCDSNCNKAYYDWDEGDCCDPDVTDTFETCIDPSSQYCMFMGEREFKTAIGLESVEYLNIYIAEYIDEALLGAATMPWDFGVYSARGGIIMHANAYGAPDVMNSVIHEVGHSLGLWHVFHGVTEIPCSEECFETEPSLELGDMIADTNPTPQNEYCRDPLPAETGGRCGLTDFYNTPFTNYMSYANDSCTSSFTPQQTARMHCYLDLFYQSWQQDREPSVMPLPPNVISKLDDSVTLTWQPPLSGHNVALNSELCHDCVTGDVLVQYGDSAFSPHSKKRYGDYSPQQATGPPNAAKCSINHRAWWIDRTKCKYCKLKVNFKYPVVPSRLTLWVTKVGTRDTAIYDIELVTVNRTRISLGAADVYCDIPYSTKINNVNEEVKSVIIYTNGLYVGIDAVQLISRPGHSGCKFCKPVNYLLTRSPQFDDGEEKLVDSTTFVDNSVNELTEYTYRVSVSSENIITDLSPPLVIGTGFRFCGNGIRESDESCDDGNVFNNDGCNVNCKEETGFKCTGEPSLCYRYDGDGHCEDFEKETNVADCGFYTPPRFYDQWASYARGNPQYQGPECPESAIYGEPSRNQVCTYELKEDFVWYPCRAGFLDHNLWLKVGFPKAVVVTSVLLYITGDGVAPLTPTPTRASVTLVDTRGIIHLLDRNVPLRCTSNPATFNVKHDLNDPFYYSREVFIELDYKDVRISGVRLRSLKAFDPLVLQSCGDDYLYSPATRQCNRYSCELPTCVVPEARHATLNRQVGDVVNEGETYTVKCDKGYRPVEKYEIMCVNGQWEEHHAMCKPVDCGFPRITYAITSCPEGTLYNRTCNFKCTPPAKMQGSDKSITCLEDGGYSLPNSFCQQQCEPPQVPDNSFQIPNQPLSYNIGSYVIFRCKAGYQIKDNPKGRRIRLKCGDDLEWSGSSCVRIECSPPPAIYRGLYNCSNGRYFHSECRINCPDTIDRVATVTCLKKGWDQTWDEAFAVCHQHMESHHCSEPQSSNEVEFTCDRNPYAIGTHCAAACNAYGHEAVVTDNGVPTNMWKSQPKYIACTAQRQWYPDPSVVSCVKGCQEDFVRDGFCDGVNNRAYCNWDGGDCCESTAIDNKVTTFLPNCKAECKCLDPNADENIQKPENV